MLRGIAFAFGLALLAATAHATIAATGGYASAHSFMTMTIAAGVGIASIAVGNAWSGERKGLAVWLVIAIVAGEAYGLLMTAERLVASREAQQAPLRDGAASYEKAAQRVAKAAAAMGRVPTGSPRLEAATKAKAAGDQATIDKAAERGCREQCRLLLQENVATAEREVGAARMELEQLAAAAKTEFDAARTALSALKPPTSATRLRTA